MEEEDKWRMCQKRPEVGFDLQWHWGPWGDLRKNWSASKHLPNLYLQRARNGLVEDFEIDHVEMDSSVFEWPG